MTHQLALTSILEALLFVASEPLTIKRLAEATESSNEAVQAALEQLSYSLHGRGLALSELDGSYRLVTTPAAATTIKQFMQEESKSELSKAALETLAIIAYRGPITKGGIEQIRGVASDTMLRNLQARDLIVEAGRSTEPGRPLRYSVSHAFLRHFGLTSPTDLPPLTQAAHEN